MGDILNLSVKSHEQYAKPSVSMAGHFLVLNWTFLLYICPQPSWIAALRAWISFLAPMPLVSQALIAAVEQTEANGESTFDLIPSGQNHHII